MGIQYCYLDENKKLILAILDNQNLGKLAECAQYQAQLQKNLMYLAAIADAQPQVTAVPAQVPPHPAMQQGAYYMQQQAAAMAQQQGVFPPRLPTQFTSPLQMHEQQHQQQHQVHQQQQQQQAIPGQMHFRPAGPSDGMHPMQTEATHGGGSSGGPPTSANPSDTRGGNKQDGPEAGSTGDGQGSSAAGAGHGSEGEPSYLKGSEEGK
ncbi:GRF1-interacting factor 2 isoform X2 [Beta vulgaris subsp. vulgaris]|uniref:GRF1-interacting factor 2 isoform X2 n=1 Tax=Beta vulgaris subsp. vulgaris TaxID=3555 RepID=UPI00053F8974|nr:GRF1-interacting factor 2 isoform X2 [Beta vulgaris subsp. vulgaris]